MISASVEAPGRALEELPLLHGAHEFAVLNHVLAAKEDVRDRTAHRLAFVRIVVGRGVMRPCRDRVLLLGIYEHDVGVRSGRKVSLAGVKPEELGRGRGGDLDEAVSRDLALLYRVPE